MSALPPSADEELTLLHAAGSLRGALTEIADAFKAATGIAVQAKYGPSGLLKDEIADGAEAHVFASANMEHPRALALENRAAPVVLFARNRLCALVRADAGVTPDNLLQRMLDRQLKLGTSTPRADPSGDYAWEVFRKAETVSAGAFAALESKALQLTGSPASPPAPSGRNIYGALVADGKADMFLTYCTNAQVGQRENRGLDVVPLPPELAVGADYGLTVMLDAPTRAYRLALFILGATGQAILAEHGFAAPALPE